MKDESAAALLPRVDKEIGDSWIYGVASDPHKLARMRIIDGLYSREMEKKSSTRMNDQRVLRNATRFALKAYEHTWGLDVKSFLNDTVDWENEDFWKAKAASSQFALLEESWWEQRFLSITLWLETLIAGHHPLAEAAQREFQKLVAGLHRREASRLSSSGRRANRLTVGGSSLMHQAGNGRWEKFQNGDCLSCLW